MDKKGKIVLSFASFIIVLFLAFILFSSSFGGAFSGSGSGNSTDPFVITNCTQLQEMNDSLTANYTINQIIDCSDTLNWNAGEGFYPVGDAGSPFLGRLFGNEYNITDLFINRSAQSRVGLIGKADGGRFYDLFLDNVEITGNPNVGALIGSASSVIINNSHSSGSVVGFSDDVGGLVGYAYNSDIDNSYSDADVNGSFNYVGGLIGYANGGSIDNSYATGEVNGADKVGGLIGYMNNVDIDNSYATGDAYGTDYVGGLVGWQNDGTINNSYATGEAEGGGASEQYIGGLVGYAKNTAEIDNSYANGSVSGLNYVGGLVGYAYGATVNNSYAMGSINGSSYVGGLVGRMDYYYYGSIDNSYATGEVNGSSDYVGGLVGYADSSTTISNSNASGRVNALGSYAGYPYYSTMDNNYVGGLIGYSAGNIDGSHASGNVLAVNGNGAGNIYGAHFGGLVGYISGATVDNSYATGNVNGSGNRVGGLAGYTNSIINNSNATGIITGGSDNVGGLVGYAYYGTIDNSYATGNVSGVGIMGGLIGRQYGGTLDNSYATGEVDGSADYIGGLVGYLNSGGTINNSYARGNVTGVDRVGGLVGRAINNYPKVDNSYATGNVNGNDYAGGLVGEMYIANVDNSYAVGNVSGASYVGGLVGKAYGSSYYYSNIDNSYATGDVVGSGSYVGGIVGYMYIANVDNSYAVGNVSGASYVGGLVGSGSDYGSYAYSNIDNSYWYNRSQELECTGSFGSGTLNCTAEESISYFYNIFNEPMLVWDFINIWDHINHLSGFPVLRSDPLNDTTAPVVDMVYPLAAAYTVNVSEINYGVSDVDSVPRYCWYSNDSGATNSSSVSAGRNFTNVTSLEGSNTWSVYCDDLAGNVGNDSVTFTKDTTAEENTSTTSTSRGGAAGGAAYGASSPTATQLAAGYSRRMGLKGRINFNIKGAAHKAVLIAIFSNRATIEVASEPQNVTLEVGEEKKIDFDEDDEYDLSIKLESVEESKFANVTIKEISEPVLIASEGLQNEDEQKQVSEEQKAAVMGVLIFTLGAIAAVVLIGAAIQFFLRAKSRKHLTGGKEHKRYIAH